MSDLLISYKEVKICQETKMVLENIDFYAHSGELIYIIGRVGTGKSTLLQSIYGELPIAGGKAEVLGFDLLKIRESQKPALRRQLGIVFQDFKLLSDRTVHANLSFVLKALGWNNWTLINTRIEEVLGEVDMLGYENLYPSELSGGEQQRVAIARSLLNKPDILLVDEPTGNLDYITSQSIFSLLTKLVEKGALVVMATHNLHLVRAFPGKVYQASNCGLEDVSSKIYKQITID